jgi:hypothetical protein
MSLLNFPANPGIAIVLPLAGLVALAITHTDRMNPKWIRVPASVLKGLGAAACVLLAAWSFATLFLFTGFGAAYSKTPPSDVTTRERTRAEAAGLACDGKGVRDIVAGTWRVAETVVCLDGTTHTLGKRYGTERRSDADARLAAWNDRREGRMSELRSAVDRGELALIGSAVLMVLIAAFTPVQRRSDTDREGRLQEIDADTSA